MKTCVSYKLHLFVFHIYVLAQVNSAMLRLRPRLKSPIYVDHPPRVVKEDDGKVRPVEVGDAVVPGDFVQIAARLMDKIPYRGKGKGIVSSANNPPALADTLFKRFFFTNRKMVFLRPIDIGGLNALQALALSGEEVKGDTVQHEYMIATTPGPHKQAPAFITPKRCRYLLLLKNRPKRSKKLRNKLSKQESTSNSSHSDQSINDTSSTTKSNDPIKVEKQASPHPGLKLVHRSPKDKCHWMYECATEGFLDSCNIHPVCERQRPNVEKQLLAIRHKEDEHTKLIKRFRRMLGVNLVDEEVEKIIEMRFYYLKDSSVKVDNRAMKQDDSISQYYGGLMHMQHSETTTASNREVIEENEVIDLELDIAEEPSVDEIEQERPRKSTGINQNEAREAKLMLAKRHLRAPKQTTVSPHAYSTNKPLTNL